MTREEQLLRKALKQERNELQRQMTRGHVVSLEFESLPTRWSFARRGRAVAQSYRQAKRGASARIGEIDSILRTNPTKGL